MKISRLIASAVIAGAVLVGTSGGLMAQAPADYTKMRQDLMRSFGANYFGPFSALNRGESTDLAGAATKATAMVADLKKIPGLFPAGSGREANPASRAKPEIWTDRATFEGNVNNLIAVVEKMGDAAKAGNMDAYKAAFAGFGPGCTACHGGNPASAGPFRFERPPQ